MVDHNHLIANKLTTQLNCLQNLAELLNDELTAIASRRGEGLKEIAKQKLTYLSQIQTLDKELNTLIISNEQQSDDIAELIKSVRKNLETCKQKNDINAHAAQQAQLSVKQLKDILIGAPTSMTYDQGGSVVQGNSKIVHNLKA